MTKKAMNDSKDGVEVLVDNKAALGNVKRFLTKEGFSITIQEGNDEYKILGRR
jgi:TusA-related sulfurtransferase